MKREFVFPVAQRTKHERTRWHATKDDRTLCAGIHLEHGVIRAVIRAETIPQPACANCSKELERGR